jgi:rhodanese-related sulfurtransferase
VGRPDLAQKAAKMTKEDLAGLLFDSLRTKVMTLADDVIVYPAHGAGSACGKNMMKETVDTLGNQKKVNYALRADMTREEFIKEVTEGLLPPPDYFPLNVQMNKEGYESIDKVLEDGSHALPPKEFKKVATKSGALVLDVRTKNAFAKSHIPRSVFIGLDGSFAPWVGDLIKDVTTPILLVVDEKRVEEAVTRLSRIGFDNTLGYLKGGVKAWKDAGFEIDTVDQIAAEKFAKLKDPKVFDVRKPSEFEAEHVVYAENVPLNELNRHLRKFRSEVTVYVHCASGYRSMVAASILKSRGIHEIIDIKGGIAAMKEAKVEISEFVCTSLV